MRLRFILLLYLLLFVSGVSAKEIGGGLLIPHFPVYPEEAVSRQLEGSVTVGFNVSKLGVPETIRVLSSTSEIFIEPCVEAISKMKFKPKLIDGKSLTIEGYRLKYEFRFDIKELYYSVHLTKVSTGAPR